MFTQDLANHLDLFLNRQDGANKDNSTPVTDAETSFHLCSKAVPNKGDTEGFLQDRFQQSRCEQ